MRPWLPASGEVYRLAGFRAVFIFPKGCTDSEASNHDPDALLDDGSCVYDFPVCDDVAPGADLRGAFLAECDLAGANMRNINLSGANLNSAVLSNADLRDADLSNANLAGANLAGANLARANLAGADLRGANLANADLVGTNLSGADLRGAIDVNFVGAFGLPAHMP